MKKWIEFFKPAPSLKPKDAESFISSSPDKGEGTLLDIRQSFERKNDIIPGSVHIPLTRLLFRAGELDPEKPVLVY